MNYQKLFNYNPADPDMIKVMSDWLEENPCDTIPQAVRDCEYESLYPNYELRPGYPGTGFGEGFGHGYGDSDGHSVGGGLGSGSHAVGGGSGCRSGSGNGNGYGFGGGNGGDNGRGYINDFVYTGERVSPIL